MSLTEAYRLAHTAECRLQCAANRPDRNLRFVVGHLMHYESLRLRIVEIEHDISKSERAKAVQFQGAGQLQRKDSQRQLGRRSPPPTPIPGLDDDDEDDLSDEDDGSDIDLDDEEEGLSLQRFPSGSARPPPLEPDEEDEVEEDEEPVSPKEPEPAALEEAMKGEENATLSEYYNGVRKCPCHGEKGAEEFGRMWDLPGDSGRDGVTRAVAEVKEKG